MNKPSCLVLFKIGNDTSRLQEWNKQRFNPYPPILKRPLPQKKENLFRTLHMYCLYCHSVYQYLITLMIRNSSDIWKHCVFNTENNVPVVPSALKVIFVRGSILLSRLLVLKSVNVLLIQSHGNVQGNSDWPEIYRFVIILYIYHLYI